MSQHAALVLFLFLLTSSVSAQTSHGIGYKAGKDMAERLWRGKFDANCFRSDPFFVELHTLTRKLSSSAYHQGYRAGIEHSSRRIAHSCHNPGSQASQDPPGECFQTGLQHGQNLGQQVCEDLLGGFRIAHTCSREALASCYDSLRSYVTRHCSQRLRQPSFKNAQLECESAFARG